MKTLALIAIGLMIGAIILFIVVYNQVADTFTSLDNRITTLEHSRFPYSSWVAKKKAPAHHEMFVGVLYEREKDTFYMTGVDGAMVPEGYNMFIETADMNGKWHKDSVGFADDIRYRLRFERK